MAKEDKNRKMAEIVGWSATSAGLAYFAGSAPLLGGLASKMIQSATLLEAPLQLQILLSSKWSDPLIWTVPLVMGLPPVLVMLFSKSARAKLVVSIGYLAFVIGFMAVADRGLEMLVQEVGESLNG